MALRSASEELARHLGRRLRASVRRGVLGVALFLSASEVQGQRARPDMSVRLAVIGQTDSAGLVLADRVRTRLADATRRRRVVVVPARDVALIIEESYRDPTVPIGVHDIREIGKLVGANIVLALVPDTVRIGNVKAIVFRVDDDHQYLPSGARTVGSWPAARAERTSIAIARAFEADPLYRRVVAH